MPLAKLSQKAQSPSSGSSGRVRVGDKKHAIYAATFGGLLFYDLFLQGRGPWHPRPPESATVSVTEILVSNQEGPILNTDGPGQPHMFYYEGLEKQQVPDS